MEQDTIYGLFSSSVADVPRRPFLWWDDEIITYGEADRLVDKYTSFLANHGISEGEKVAVLSSNNVEFIYLLLATAKLGGTFVPLDYRQEGDVLTYLLDDAAPAILIVEGNAYDQFDALDADTDIEDVFYLDVGAVDREKSLRNALERTETDRSVSGNPGPADVAIINYTSGTTGPPKGVQNPHRAFVEAGRRIVEHCSTGAEHRGLIVLPLFHANPQTYGLMHMLAAGGSLAVREEFSASDFWPAARASQSTFFTHVGSVLEILFRAISDDNIDPETPLEFTVGGAAHFDGQRAFEQLTGIQVVRLYGLSEVGGGVVTMNRYHGDTVHGSTHQGSIARQPFDVRILDESGTKWLDAEERGEIVIRPEVPATMFAGYLGKHAETVEVWRDLWMHTGDIGWVDEDNNLHYVGRLKANIRKKGENISPWEIETVVHAFPFVTEAVAVGMSDPVAGEEIKLCVVLSDETVTAETVFERCRDDLAEHLVPRYIEIFDELPRTSTQKIDRMTLQGRKSPSVWDSRDHRSN